MNTGFQTWKDILEVIIVPITLALIAVLWPEIQLANRRRVFRGLIFRELKEIFPSPNYAEEVEEWFHHQRRDFIHKKIFENPSENRELILSLPPDLVYHVSQLWSALSSRDEDQWLYFLGKLSLPKYDSSGEIKKAHMEWVSLVDQYKKSREKK